jgi:beta-lactamase regulating signal transducer with metallopeptidase domain
MSHGARYFLLLQAAIAMFYLLWRLSAWCEGASSRQAGARRWAALGKIFLAAALAAPLLCAALERLPASRQMLPSTPLAGRILLEADGPGDGSPAAGDPTTVRVSEGHPPLPIDVQAATLAVWALGATGMLLVRARQWGKLRRLLAGAVPVRRAGRVEILVRPETLSPFATRVRGMATVVVPSFLVESGRWREAVRHELQHHRQGDPRWTLAWDALTALLWANPAIWLWRRRARELQELACDDCLLESNRVNPAAYGETLLDVAEALSALPAARQGECCSALAGPGSPALLARRLDRIINHSLLRRPSMKGWAAWFLAGACLWVVLAAAWAGGGSQAGEAPAELRLVGDLQALAEQKLSAHLERCGARRGVVVAMDPSTGAVLARAGLRRDEVTHRLVAEDAAASTLQFPGASTMKTLVVAGALQAGAVDVSDTFDTGNGTLSIDGRTYREWKDGGLGNVSPADIIVKSSNLGVIQVARRLGAGPLSGFLRQLGLTVAPDARAEDLGWGNDGAVSVTAQQLAYAYAALVNGGRLPGSGETLLRPDVSDWVRTALVKAVEEGTGTQARCNGLASGGKTGTSIREAGGVRTGTAYFVGFAPAEAPRVVVSVIVDDVGGDVNGNRHAASLFRELVVGGLPLLAASGASAGGVSANEAGQRARQDEEHIGPSRTLSLLEPLPDRFRPALQ